MNRNVVAALLIAASQIRAAAPAFSAPPPPKGIEAADVDRSADPCTDFYRFANGAWREANPIPPSMPKWSRRVAAHEANAQRVRTILDELSRRNDWPRGSAGQVAGDHYAACMDQSAVDAAGLAPIAPLLAEIDGARTAADVQRVIRRLHDLAVAVPFGVAGAMDYRDPSRYVANVAPGGLGMSGPDDYRKYGAPFEEAREKYRAHVARVLVLGGTPESAAGRTAAEIFGLEKRLAEATTDPGVDPAATDHPMAFAELRKLAPHVDWTRYFDEARLPRADVNVADPAFLREVDRELAETPTAVWKAYLRWQLLESASPWLSTPFVREDSAYRDGEPEKKPRAARCAESVESLFGDALGEKYVERFFPPAAKAKAQEIAANLLAALKDEVAGVDWMAPETRKTALEKLAALDVEMGYPDAREDYSGVVVRRDAFFANVAAGRRFGVDEDRRRIGKPTRRNHWALPASSPDAYIDFQLNLAVLPAGFLQAPYFDPDATDAANYGALGIGLAHDMTHFIDEALGSANDAHGRPRNWWTDADRSGFETRGRCLVDQFEGYSVAPGVHHDGKRVLGEAVGDLAGVRIAFRALEKSMEARPGPVVDGFTPEQQFFIAWGQATGAAMRPEAERKLVAGDPHPVPKYRVVGPLSNSPDFQKAFSCPMNAAMVRPPEMRCVVW